MDKPARHEEPTLDALGLIFRNSLVEGQHLAKQGRPIFEAAKQRVLECGWTALRARKLATSNIEFGKWLEKYGPDVRRETVWRWMQTAQRYAEKLVGPVVAGRQQLPALTPNHLKLFLQLTDGKTC